MKKNLQGGGLQIDIVPTQTVKLIAIKISIMFYMSIAC